MVPSATLVVRRPKEEVAMVARALVPLPRTRPYEKDDAPVPPLPTPSVPVRRFVPIEVVAMMEPFALVERMALGMVVMAKAVEVAVASVVCPEKVSLSERRVKRRRRP